MYEHFMAKQLYLEMRTGCGEEPTVWYSVDNTLPGAKMKVS